MSDTIHFALDMYDIDPTSRAILDSQAAWLSHMARPAASRSKAIADERGTREYNLALGDRRANAAKNYLAAKRHQPGADHHDQLRQGTPDRAGLGRSQLGAEPPRGDHRPQLDAAA